MFNKKGFTLAEVLIVLAVIGVVAALTIPMLMSNYQKTQQVTALKKVVSQISEAIERVMTDSNVENFNDVTLLHGSDPDYKTFFKTYFKVSKYCDNSHATECFIDQTSSIDKNVSTYSIANSNKYCAILKDGSSICINNWDPTNWITTFLIDTNGFDKPNIGGRDIFTLSVYYDGSVDEVPPNNRDADDNARELRKGACESNFYGAGCYSKIFDAGWKMDY